MEKKLAKKCFEAPSKKRLRFRPQAGSNVTGNWTLLYISLQKEAGECSKWRSLLPDNMLRNQPRPYIYVVLKNGCSLRAQSVRFRFSTLPPNFSGHAARTSPIIQPSPQKAIYEPPVQVWGKVVGPIVYNASSARFFRSFEINGRWLLRERSS
jgi:hypothetical protein